MAETREEPIPTYSRLPSLLDGMTSAASSSNSLLPAAFYLPQVQELQQATDLNRPPDNWLCGDIGLELLHHGPSPNYPIPLPPVPPKDLVVPGSTDIEEPCASTSREPPPMSGTSRKDLIRPKSPSLFIAESFPDAVGHADMISTSDCFKKLVKAPFGNRSLSMVVHRVGSTVLVDDLNLRQFQMGMTGSDSEDGASEKIFEAVREVVQMEKSSDDHQLSLERLKKDSCKSRERKLYSKFLAHSVSGTGLSFPLQVPGEHVPTLESRLSLPSLDFTNSSALAVATSTQLCNLSVNGISSSICNDKRSVQTVMERLDGTARNDLEDEAVTVPALTAVLPAASTAESRPEVVNVSEVATLEMVQDKLPKLPELTYTPPNIEEELAHPDMACAVVGSSSPKLADRSDVVGKRAPLVADPMRPRRRKYISSARVHPMGRQAPFSKLSNWRFNNLRMVLGSNLPIFGCGKYPAVSLRLNESSQGIDVLTGIDYWLDNLICSVPELVMCWHVSGVVQRYSMLKTEEIPNVIEGGFDPEVVSNITANIMDILHSGDIQEGHTYWLYRARGNTVIILYDLTALCFRKPDTKSSDNPYAIPVAILLYRTARHWLVDSKSNYRLRDVASLLTNCIPLLKDSPQSVEVLVSSHLLLSSIFISGKVVERPPTDPLIFAEKSVNSSQGGGPGSTSAHNLPVQERMMQGISDSDDDEDYVSHSTDGEDNEREGVSGQTSEERSDFSGYPDTPIQQVDIDLLRERPRHHGEKREDVLPLPTALVERAEKAVTHIEEALVVLEETVQGCADCLQQFLQQDQTSSSSLSADGKSVTMKSSQEDDPTQETVLSLDENGFVVEGACVCGVPWYVHAGALMSDRVSLAMHVLASCSFKENRFGRALRHINTAIAFYELSTSLACCLHHHGCIKWIHPSRANHVAAILLKADCFLQMRIDCSGAPGADRKTEKRHPFHHHAKEYSSREEGVGVALVSWLRCLKGSSFRISPTELQNTPSWLDLQYQITCTCALDVGQYTDGADLGKTVLSPELYNTMVGYAAFANNQIGLLKLDKIKHSLSKGTLSAGDKKLALVKQHFDKAYELFQKTAHTESVVFNMTRVLANLANCAHISIVHSHRHLLMSANSWHIDQGESKHIADMLLEQRGYWRQAAQVIQQMKSHHPNKWDEEVFVNIAISNLALAVFYGHVNHITVKDMASHCVKESLTFSNDCSRSLEHISGRCSSALHAKVKYCDGLNHCLRAMSASRQYREAGLTRSKVGLNRKIQLFNEHWQKALTASKDVERAVLLPCYLHFINIVLRASLLNVEGKTGFGPTQLNTLLSYFDGILPLLRKYTIYLKDGSQGPDWDCSVFAGVDQCSVLLSFLMAVLQLEECKHNFSVEPLHCVVGALAAILVSVLQQAIAFTNSQGGSSARSVHLYTSAKDSLSEVNGHSHQSACQKFIDIVEDLCANRSSRLSG